MKKWYEIVGSEYHYLEENIGEKEVIGEHTASTESHDEGDV